MEIKNKIFLLAFLLVLLTASLCTKYLTPAAVSNVNVYVPGFAPVPAEQSGQGGGSALMILNNIPPANEEGAPPVSQPQPSSAVSSNGNVNDNAVASPGNLAPVSVASLSEGIPQLANIFSNLGISATASAASLKDYNIVLPGSQFIKGQQDKIPKNKVFILGGNKNIGAQTSVSFSGVGAAEVSRVLAGSAIHLVVRPDAGTSAVSGRMILKSSGAVDSPQFTVATFIYTADGDGNYFADIKAPSVKGQYEIITKVSYGNNAASSKDIKTMVLIDPEGYVYEEVGGKQLLINNATVSLYNLNVGKAYELWSAAKFGQENPQITDSTGRYAFLVPAGTYYLTVSAQGYNTYKSDPFLVQEGKEVHANVALTKNIQPYSAIDWKAIAIIILFFMILFNFYRDGLRWKKTKK